MAIVEFRKLSLSEAEEVVAEIWNCLEEYHIPSPQMNFAFGEGDAVTMDCRFREPLWARIVATRLANWLASSERRMGIPIDAQQSATRRLAVSSRRRAGRRGASHPALAGIRQVSLDRA